MVTSIPAATQVDPTSASTSAITNQKAAQSQPPATSRNIVDTVQISSNAAQAAVQEASETPGQTTREARSGDHQAQRLLAREAATKKA